MRSRTSDWFEIKIRYAKTQEDGTLKNVTEHYVVDALSFTEAEGAIMEEMKAFISGDYKITDIKPAAYHEIFFSSMDKSLFSESSCICFFIFSMPDSREAI